MGKISDRFEILSDRAALARRVAEWMTLAALAAKRPFRVLKPLTNQPTIRQAATAAPDNQIRVAREAERLGYYSLWVFQRLLYALEPRNEYPPVPGKVWPKLFECVFDPIVSLSYVAAATIRIRLGTSVLIMPFYAPASEFRFNEVENSMVLDETIRFLFENNNWKRLMRRAL